jgi:hypothetical protein
MGITIGSEGRCAVAPMNAMCLPSPLYVIGISSGIPGKEKVTTIGAEGDVFGHVLPGVSNKGWPTCSLIE